VIPSTALVIKEFNPKTATLDELTLFLAPDQLDVGEQVVIFRRFCITHTEWTRREVGALTADEIAIVSAQIGERIKEAAVPKATSPV